ncbi:MAG: hypothetical protein EOM05_10425 [Clostridia bacterium]|nr:hypothetical protein [Clostridia bacterium]
METGMKHYFLLALFFLIISSFDLFAQGVSVSESGSVPHESAIMDISSTDKGVLFPRMTTLERDVIDNPAESLVIFNTDTKCFETYVYGVWQSLWCGTAPCIPSSTPSSIIGDLTVCSGNSTILSIDGGSLGTGALWHWYSSSCGGIVEGEGATLTVAPSVNTTYYARAEGDCGITDCVQATVNVISAPTAPIADIASVVSADGFVANWQAVSGATSYFLEVSDNIAFSSFVYNVDVGNNLSHTIELLSCASTYYYRVRAVNTCDESDNSNTITVTTDVCSCNPIPCPGTPTVVYQDYTYNTVQIGTQCWMVENLRNTQYNNGSSILESQSDAEWSTTGTTGKYCTPPSGNGLFYDFYAASSSNNICPTGWRTPTQSDFNTLVAFIPDASSIMDDNTWAGTNSCGWTGVQGGYRAANGTFYDAQHGFWWTSTNYDSTMSIDFRLYDYFSYQINTYGSLKTRGHYVKCIKQ